MTGDGDQETEEASGRTRTTGVKDCFPAEDCPDTNPFVDFIPFPFCFAAALRSCLAPRS